MRCGTVADDGARCVLEDHPNDRDGHDFAESSGDPVDGGRSWRDWIKSVYAVRDLLMPQTVDRVTLRLGLELDQRVGFIEGWSELYCREILKSIAVAVDLEVVDDVIRERAHGQGT